MTTIKNPFKEMYWQELRHGYELSLKQRAILLRIWLKRRLFEKM